MSRYRLQRERLVRELELKRGIRDEFVLDAMRRVPRHRYVPEHLLQQAYVDYALPIGEEQTISQPYIVARMTEWLEVGADHSVLEIGTGSGYQTAILALLARVVYSIERVPSLAREAMQRIRELDVHNVKVQIFDGTVGHSQFAPYDRILVTAGAPHAPRRLLEQLGDRGILVVPEGGRQGQHLVRYTRDRNGQLLREVGEAVSFVPLIGRDGWADATAEGALSK